MERLSNPRASIQINLNERRTIFRSKVFDFRTLSSRKWNGRFHSGNKKAPRFLSGLFCKTYKTYFPAGALSAGFASIESFGAPGGGGAAGAVPAAPGGIMPMGMGGGVAGADSARLTSKN